MKPTAPRPLTRLLAVVSLFLGAWVTVAACTGPAMQENQAEHLGTTAQAFTTAITISGQARSASGAPLAGVTIQLVGASSGSQTTTSNGNYSFSGLPQGSYVVQPTLLGCSFIPSPAILPNLTANTTQNFAGSGLSCGGAAQGILTIAGTVANAVGQPMSGIVVTLTGPSSSIATTGATGAFSFSHLVPGTYIVQPALLGCTFATATLATLTDSTTISIGGSGTTCAGPAPGPITISGTARNALGAPLSGATIVAVGPSIPAPVTTDASGHYSFAGLTAGSYAVTPALVACGFVPSVATLGNLIANTTQNFDGSGATCGGSATGTLTISGLINDANGLPLSGVSVGLAGSLQVPQTTGATGTFSFSNVAPGSYIVQPALAQCTFQQLTLGNLTDSTSVVISGSGASCGGGPSVNAGALTGPLTISGHVLGASGGAVVGAQINLTGASQATRFTDATGGYTFNLAPGTYTLTPSAACPIAPQLAVVNAAANFTQNFTVTTAGCTAPTTTATVSNVISTGEVITLQSAGAVTGVTYATIENQSTPAGATARLQAIGKEVPAPIKSLTIAGFPAIERQATINPPSTEIEGAEIPGNHAFAAIPKLILTTAIADGSSVVRFDTSLPTGASLAQIASVFATGRNFTPAEVSGLHGPPPTTVPAAPVVAPATPTSSTPALVPAVTGLTYGEVAIAASDSSNSVVYAANGTHTGDTSGEVWNVQAGGAPQQSQLSLNPGTTIPVGDPSMALGAPNPGTGLQRFYYSEIFVSPGGDRTVGPYQNVVFQSGDSTGVTFAQTATSPVNCGNASANCVLADQAQLGADRRTQSSKGDRLYIAWRNFTTTKLTASGTASNFSGAAATCSFDGGASWRPIDMTSFPQSTDFPRLSVAPDGSVFIAVETGATSGSYSLWVHKFSPCDAGFTQLPGFPVNVAPSVGELPSLAGLDRQPNGGEYIVAPDDSDLTGQRLFLVFARENSTSGTNQELGNEDIVVAESTNGGANWTVANTPVNSTSTGYRFFPWACSTNGRTYVTWYDRRDATEQKPDLTSYYWGSVTDPTHSGTPTISADTSVSGPSSDDDAQCKSGFVSQLSPLAAPSDPRDETNCNSDLPTSTVGAGICTTCSSSAIETDFENMTSTCGSLAPCDFRSSNPCAVAGESCDTELGEPKYGDYNGAACARGLLFLAWASASRPRGVTCAQAGGTCSIAADCCGGASCTGGICVPSGRSTCTGNGAACTMLASCCSNNCLAGTCEPGVNVYTYATSCTTCPGETGCVDIANSASDCGGCGHKCQGVCSSGVCQPIVMFTSAPTNQTTWGVASDGTNVYFTTHGVVSQPPQVLTVPAASPVAGVPATPSVIPISTSGPTSLYSIVLDSQSPYLLFDDRISGVYAARKLGGSVTPVTDTISSGVVDVAISGTNGYALSFGGVVLQPLPSGTTTVLAPTVDPVSITADPNNVYWTDVGANGSGNYTTGTIMKIPAAGGTPTTLASGQGFVAGIGVDATNVYWVNENSPPSVAKVPIAGGAVTTMANVPAPPPPGGGPSCCAGISNVVSDGTNIYYGTHNYTTNSGGQIWTVPAIGGTPVLLVNDAAGDPLTLALDGNNIYWTNGTNVEKIALLGH